MPPEAFDPALMLRSRVDLRVRVCVWQRCYYSVPARYVGRTMRLSATTVGGLRWRQAGGPARTRGGSRREVLVLDHYLEVFKSKPWGTTRRDRAGSGQVGRV